VAIADIDTRKLTRLLREKGAQNGCIIAGDNLDAALALEKAKSFPGLNGMDLAKEVTTAEPYSWTQGSWTLKGELPEAKKKMSCRCMWWPTISARNVTSCVCWWTRLPPDGGPGENLRRRRPENESGRYLPL
jgi:carbamoyl-phosphate synthase small subunit